MKQKKTHLVLSFAALAALAAFVTFVARTGYGQAQTEAQATAARPLALVPETRPASEPAAATKPATTTVEKDASLFAAAAARNTLLKYELSWAFGGKQQRGWYLYTPLISRMLETTGGEAAGDGFAAALSRWQKSSGLEPSGVLDGDTLYRMVGEWQGARLKHKAHARPEELLLAPVSDFYDPTRPEALRHVERETYAAYKRMLAAAPATSTSAAIRSRPKTPTAPYRCRRPPTAGSSRTPTASASALTTMSRGTGSTSARRRPRTGK